MRLQGKKAVVTGGSSGIGLAITELFVQEGAQVAVIARDENKLRAVEQRFGDKVICFTGDVSKVDSLEEFYKFVKEKYGSLDIVVANAGVAIKGFISEVTEEEFDTIVNTNFKGTVFTVNKSLAILKDGGSIILISSMAGNLGVSGNGVYGATKAAINHLSTTLSAELASTRRIRVNVISPGYTMTPAVERLLANDPLAIEKRKKNIPLGEFAKPEEIAQVALFLATDAGRYVCGQNLIVDGGVSAVFPNSSYKGSQVKKNIFENKMEDSTERPDGGRTSHKKSSLIGCRR